MEEAWELLVEKLAPPGAGRFKGERFSAAEHSASDIVSRASVLPMFGSRRLLMVKSVNAWKKEDAKLLKGYLKKPAPSACLVLAVDGKKSDLEKDVQKHGCVVEFAPLTERSAPAWIQQRARRLGKGISRPAALSLVELAGVEAHLLVHELEKLSLYTGERRSIEEGDVREVVGSQRSFTIFQLTDYVGARQARQALTALDRLMLAGESPLGVLALLARQTRILWQVKDAQARGVSPSQMAQTLRLPEFVIRKYVQQAALFSPDRFPRIHEALRQADIAMKSTGLSPVTVLEDLVVRLCSSERKGGGSLSPFP